MKTRPVLSVGLCFLLIAVLGHQVAYAAGHCVHPTGAGRCFSSIQAAVDAASAGDRIVIRPGIYVEQVTVAGKDLTLVGRSGAVLQAPENMQDTLSPMFGFPGRPLLLVTDANVIVRGLTFDGANSAERNPFLQGVVFLNAGGVIRDNTIENIGFGEPRLPLDANGEPVYQGDAVVVVNFLAQPRAVTITGNRIVGFNNNGILVDAEADPGDPAAANLVVEITGNTVIGAGANEVIDQWGIFVGGFNFSDPQASITGTVRNNRIRDLVTAGSFPLPGVGIVMVNPAGLEVVHNRVDNVNVGLAGNQVTGSRIAHNQIIGPKPGGFGSTGLLISGSDTLVVENRFRRLDAGVLLLVADPELGSAYSMILNDNRFEGVATDLLTSPAAGLSATADGTATTTDWSRLPHR